MKIELSPRSLGSYLEVFEDEALAEIESKASSADNSVIFVEEIRPPPPLAHHVLALSLPPKKKTYKFDIKSYLEGNWLMFNPAAGQLGLCCCAFKNFLVIATKCKICRFPN